MKIGLCMLLWTTHVTGDHRVLLEDIKATGYDGIEVPVFEGEPEHYAELGRILDGLGLERTAIAVIPAADKDPLSDDSGVRHAAIDYLKHCLDCTAALGAKQLAGPLHQVLGQFSGGAPTADEFARAREVHRVVGDYAQSQGVTLALEAVNRFEAYFANTMDDLAAYLDTLDHPAVTAMYDTFHANIEEQDPVAAFTRNAHHVSYVHASENDRGVPGRGHVRWPEALAAIRRSGYDRWITIEAFSRGLPELAAATRVWRDFAESPEVVYREGYRCIRESWDAA